MAARIRFLPSGESVCVDDGATLHDAIRRVGLPIASACGADGLCGRCGVAIRSGAAHLSDETPEEVRTKRANRVDATERLACRARVGGGEVAISARYW